MNDIGGFSRFIRACEERGELTKQQRRTLIGQAKHGDLQGAYRGMQRLLTRTVRDTFRGEVAR